MKKFLKWVIIQLIQTIESIEYRNLELDENDINKKILQSNDIDIEVESDKGFVQSSSIHKTQPYKLWEIKLENGYSLECADKHLVFDSELNEIFAYELKIGDELYTNKGNSKIISIEKKKNKISMFDLSIDSLDHRYYTNGILSHNTITASITILYYCIFNNDKTVMIAANKKATTDEIVTKIKSIYYQLPWWIKPGVANWNQSQITFGDSGCRIRTSAATKTAAIGFSVDFLYLDEFGHIAANIVGDYYRSIFPTVSAIKNSKIVVTSTPNGYNLFWKILNGAEKPIGDKDKNNYKAMRVYWWQVPGRFTTYLRLDTHVLESYNLSPDDILDWVIKLGFEPAQLDEDGRVLNDGARLLTNNETQKQEIHIPNRSEYIPKWINDIIVEKEWENPLSDFFRNYFYEKEDIKNGEKYTKKIKCLEFADISSWKEGAILDIGSLEAFNQEYDLQFLSGSKMILDSQTMNKIENQIIPFEWQEIPVLEDRTFVPYEDLKWISDRPDIFTLEKAKDYHIVMSVDIAEGLGGDYSVINIFNITMKPEEQWSKDPKTVYDFFRLEQVGLFHNNRTSVQELGEILYLLCFEVFDDNKVSVVLEANNWGNELTNKMLNIYNGMNNYGNHIFYRYKHREDALKRSIGIKLRSQKNMLVKEYQKRIKMNDVIIHDVQTLQEMTTFIKKDTSTGYKFEADTGTNDDITMTVVESCTVFDNVLFHEQVNTLLEGIDQRLREKMEKYMGESTFSEVMDYSVLNKAKARVASNNNNNNNWGRSIDYGNSNPFSTGFGNNNSGWKL